MISLKNALILGAAVAGVVIRKKMYNDYKKDIANAIDKEAYNAFGKEMKEARSNLAIAKSDAQKIFNAEIAETKSIVEANKEYMTAKIAVESGKGELKVLKNALNDAKKGNSTQVAAASGNSAVSVSIKDTSQITALQTDISKLEREIKQNEITRDTIWRTERKTVELKRSAEDAAIINNVKVADRHVDHVKFQTELFKNELKEDSAFMDAVASKAYLKHYTPTKLILSMTLISLPAVLILSYGWYYTV